MDFLLNCVDWYWNTFLGTPLDWVRQTLHYEEQVWWQDLAWKVCCSLVFLILLYDVYLRARAAYRSRKFRKTAGEVRSEEDGHSMKDPYFVNKLEAAKAPEQTIAALTKAKKWEELAEVYGGLNRFKEAAWAWRKAGNLKRAAMELAKGGNTAKAARWLEKAGDYANAGRFYAEIGKIKQAIRALRKGNDLPGVAELQSRAGEHAAAAETYLQLFNSAGETLEKQVEVADRCFTLVRDSAFAQGISRETGARLLNEIAERFAAAGRNDLAAQLFRRAGNPRRAGEIYQQMGRMDEAALCLKEAGAPRR